MTPVTSVTARPWQHRTTPGRLEQWGLPDQGESRLGPCPRLLRFESPWASQSALCGPASAVECLSVADAASSARRHRDRSGQVEETRTRQRPARPLPPTRPTLRTARTPFPCLPHPRLHHDRLRKLPSETRSTSRKCSLPGSTGVLSDPGNPVASTTTSHALSCSRGHVRVPRRLHTVSSGRVRFQVSPRPDPNSTSRTAATRCGRQKSSVSLDL